MQPTTIERDPAAGAVPLRRNRDFMLLWSGQAISTLGSQASTTAYPLLVLALTNSPGLAGLVGFTRTLPNLLVQIAAGVLVDRLDRKRLMIVCDVGRAACLGSLVLALAAGRLTLAQVGVVAFLEGTMTVFFELALPGAIRKVVPREQIALAASRGEARTRAAWLFGPPLGGALFGLDRLAPFVADIVSYGVSLVCLLNIRSEFQEARKGPPRSLLGEAREGVVWLWRQPFLRMAVLLIAGTNLGFQALLLILVVVARRHGASPALVGLMLGGAGAGGLLGALLAPSVQRRLPAAVIVIGVTWAWALLVPMVLVSSDPAALGAVFAALAFAGPLLNVVIVTYQLRIVPDAMLARVTSVGLLVAYGAIPLGPLAAGLLMQAMGTVQATLALAGWMLALAVVATLSPSVRRPPPL